MWKPHERRNWMISLFIGSVGLYASRTVLPICSVFLANEMLWNRQDMGLVMGVFFWGYAMTQFLAGYLSDRLGGECVIPCSSFVWALLTLSFAYLPLISPDPSTIFGAFVCARFLLGVFQGFYYPSLVSLMSRRVKPTERNFTHAVLNGGTHCGTLLCGSLGSYLATTSGWRVPFAVIGLTYIFWSLATYMLIARPTNSSTSQAIAASAIEQDILNKSLYAPDFRDEEMFSSKVMKPFIEVELPSPDCGTSPVLYPARDSPRLPKPLSWNVLSHHPPFWAMLFANFAHNNTFYIILNWCPSYFHDNYPDARSWVFNMVPWIIIFPSTLLSGLIADRWIVQGMPVTFVRKAINTVVLLFSSMFLLILSTLDNYYSSLCCMALALACLGFHCSGVLLNPQDLSPSHGGQLYGLMATVGTIPGFFSVYIAGYLLEVTNQWSIVFSLTALLGILGWLLYTKYGSSEPIL